MKKNIYDILVIGNVAGIDMIFAESISRYGLNCCVVNYGNTNIKPLKTFNKEHIHIVTYKNPFQLLKLSLQSRLILSFTGSFAFKLQIFWFLKFFLRLPPIINYTTGSDITELIKERTINGFIYRNYLKRVNLNWCANYPNAIENIVKFNVPNVVFMNYPWCIFEDTDKDISKNEGPLVFFHASHLDWKVTDSKADRNSTKGNDRFIRAFSKAIKDGLDAKCIILDRGPDKDEARKLISDLGISDRFIWKKHLSRDELAQEFSNADVIVDQFDVGGIGGISLEAMSLGKPVMIYVNEHCAKLIYNDRPPVLNCKSEEEIYKQIFACTDKQYLFKLGNDAQKWVNKYHLWANGLEKFMFYYYKFTKHRVVNYGIKTS